MVGGTIVLYGLFVCVTGEDLIKRNTKRQCGERTGTRLTMKAHMHPDCEQRAAGSGIHDLLGGLYETADYPSALICNISVLEGLKGDKSRVVRMAIHRSPERS
jgi:hypothetical protein